MRVQRRRARGWRNPGAVIVDRTTKWGNPFVVGGRYTRNDCARLHDLLLRGYVCLTCKVGVPELESHMRWVRSHIHMLVGRTLACWCPLDAPCHADNLATLAEVTEEERVARARVSRTNYRRQRALA